MTKQRVVGAALAAAVAASAVAPVADGAMPAVCSNERTGETLAQIWGGSDFWAVNVFGDQSTIGQAQINAVEISMHQSTWDRRPEGEFPLVATFEVRTNTAADYVDTVGYGGVNANGVPVLYVFLPEPYDTTSDTLQIRTYDPDQTLPSPSTGAFATLHTASAAQASLKTLDEFGEPAQQIPVSMRSGVYTIPEFRRGLDGTIHFDPVPACMSTTVRFGTPKYSKYVTAENIQSEGLAPATMSDLGTRTIPFEPGSLSVSVSNADGQRAMNQAIQVEGPGGAQTLTTNDGGLLTLSNARPGTYTFSATSNGTTLRKTVFLKPGEDLSESAKFVAAPGSGTQSTTTVTSTVVVSETVTPPMATVTQVRSVTVTRTVPATTETGAPVVVTSTAPQPVVTQTPSVATTTQTVAVDPNGRVVLLATLAAVATLGGAVAAVMGSVPGLDVQQLAARIGGGN